MVKAEERAARSPKDGPEVPRSALDDVTVALPALTRAVKLQARAGRVGFDWADARLVLDKLAEESREVAEAIDGGNTSEIEDEIGDLLFTVANLARHLEIDPETALRGTNAKFERRFRFIESGLAAQGKTPADSSLAEMEALWIAAKRSDPCPPG